MHEKKVINNSIIALIFKILMLVIGFVSRKIFIVFLSEEVLGLNSLYSNLLDLLNLADLGIGVAVQYQLYGPLVNKDYIKQSKILSAAKKIYNLIGVIVLLTGIVLSFFIRYLIEETTFPISFVRTSFLISVTGVALGYFFVHKRLFLNADENMGMVNIIDLISKVCITVISLILTIVFRNYFLYLIINASYSLIANIFIHFIFKRHYPDIVSNMKDISAEKKELTADLKNVIPMKFSNYVYNSTDYMIISRILGFITIARYSNYMTVINGIMGVEYLIGNVVSPSIGKLIKEKNNGNDVYQYYLLYQYTHFVFTNFCTFSLTLVLVPFISIWLGSQYLFDSIIMGLLVFDFYIHSMYQPAYVMYAAAGKFKNDKIITIISGVLNIVISLIAVHFIGLSGVILGTILTDIYIWIVRSYQMVGKYFMQSIKKHVMLMAKYTFITILCVAISVLLSVYLSFDNLIADLIIKLLICIVVPNLISIAFTFKSAEYKNAKQVIHNRVNVLFGSDEK